MKLKKLERAVLAKLLAGDHSALKVLRAQAANLRLVSQRNTGVGFFCSFEVPSEVPRLEPPSDFHFGDVDAEVGGLENGAGFVLFVRGGCLDTLEGYSYEEPWPEEVGAFRLKFRREPRELGFLKEFAGQADSSGSIEG